MFPNGEGEFTQYKKAANKGTMLRPPSGTVHKEEFVEDENDCYFEELNHMLAYDPNEIESDEGESSSEDGEIEDDESDDDENE